MERFRILEPSQLSHSPSSGVCRVLTVGTVGDVERAQLAHFPSHPSAAKSWLHGCHYCFQHPPRAPRLDLKAAAHSPLDTAPQHPSLSKLRQSLPHQRHPCLLRDKAARFFDRAPTVPYQLSPILPNGLVITSSCSCPICLRPHPHSYRHWTFPA